MKILKKTNMEKKETATEWLFKQLWEEPKDKFTWNAILSKAKEKEKQQIIDSFEIGYDNGACVQEGNSIYHGGNYYNETFKQD